MIDHGSLVGSEKSSGWRLRGPLRLPWGIFFFEQRLRPVAQPGVAVAAFVADVSEAGLGDAVTVGVDRLVGGDVIEAGPDRRGGGVLNDYLICAFGSGFVGLLDNLNAGELGGLEPSDG